MTWIKEIASDKPSILTVASLLPKANEAVYNITRATGYGASPLTRVQEEAIGVAVSVVNRCRY